MITRILIFNQKQGTIIVLRRNKAIYSNKQKQGKSIVLRKNKGNYISTQKQGKL